MFNSGEDPIQRVYTCTAENLRLNQSPPNLVDQQSCFDRSHGSNASAFKLDNNNNVYQHSTAPDAVCNYGEVTGLSQFNQSVGFNSSHKPATAARGLRQL